MGALPSRESNEDPSTVFFANCGSHVVFHIPMTPHFFPAPDGLAFRQLFHARNNQSALYCFDMKDVSSVLPKQVAEAFREAQDEDWGEEAEATDPSVHYYDEEINEKMRECGAAASAAAPSVGRHFRHSVEDPASLYKMLIEEPTAGTLVDTDAEMCELFEAEQRWRAAVAQEFSKSATPQKTSSEEKAKNGGDQTSSTAGVSSDAVRSHHEGDEEDGAGAGPSTASLPPPPKKFLYPLPHAIALRMTTEEEEEMRAEYCQLHNIPYVAPHLHDVKPGSTPPMMDAAALAQLGVPRTSSSTCFVACPMPLPLPLVERRRYHFEDDPKYRDGRVHLVEEHGVLYHFAYFPKKRRHDAAAKTSNAAAAGVKAADTPTSTPIVLDRCLHDVVYSEEPDTSVSNSKQHAAAAAAAASSPFSSSPSGTTSNVNNEPEVAPAKRYGRCARCGARIEQRMDYTQLRRLKATRLQRRELRRAEELAQQQQQQQRLHENTSGAGLSSNTADDSEDAAAQRAAWAAFAAAREAEKKNGCHNDDVAAAAHGSDSDDAPGSDNDLEVASHTERVEEEGEAEFIINIAPVRIAGMDGLLPSRTRGTPWLRGYEHEDEAAADQYVEQLPYTPPVMRSCRFIDGSVGDKIVNRATLVTLLSYRPMCRQAGLSNALTRPVWSTCVLSNIPYLQMVRETFFRAKAAVAEIDDSDMLLRQWLDVVDRENNFYNFINANLYMMRNFTPPERTVRQHEPIDEMNSTMTTAGAASDVTGGFGNGSVDTGHGNSIASSPLLQCPAGKVRSFEDGAGHAQLSQHNSTHASAGLSSTRDPRGEDEDTATSARCSEHDPQQRQLQHRWENTGDDEAFAALPSTSSLCASAVPVTATSANTRAATTSTTMTTMETAGHAGLSTANSAVASTHADGGDHHLPHSVTVHAKRTGDDDAVAAAATAGVSSENRTASTTAVKGKRKHDEDVAVEKNNSRGQTGSMKLRSHHLTRDLEEATIGRPEGHGPRDIVEEDFDDDDTGEDNDGGDDDDLDSESRGEDVARGNDARARAARRREEKLKAKGSKKSKTKKAAAAPATAGVVAAGDGGTSPKQKATWRSPATAGVALHSLTSDTPAADVDADDTNNDDDGGEASGKPTPPPAPHTSGENDEREADEDADLRMEEEGQARGSSKTKYSSSAGTAASNGDKVQRTFPLTVNNEHAGTHDTKNADQPPLSSLTPPRVEVPPRPNFQLFSSRLEPHAPLSLYSLFDYDISTDAAMAGSHAGSPTVGADLSAKAREEAATSAATNGAATAESTFPSYVQHDVLRENARRQAEPKSMRRPSHALYECGMLATTRGRSFLFLLREDCVHALLYYLSSAAAPIFIGAYIEPVDTTSVSYGGAVRLQPPSAVNLPLEEAEGDAAATVEEATSGVLRNGGDSKQMSGTGRTSNVAASKLVEDGGELLQCSGATHRKGGVVEELRSADARHVVIGPVEGMEVMAEYFKSKGLITCFSVSDVERIAPGPSAAHRLRKMILPPSHLHLNVNNSSSGSCSSLQDEEHALAVRQAREAAQFGHIFTYAAQEFCDGDLVVYNFDERRWEHYEHVQLRRRFASKAAAIAAGGGTFYGGESHQHNHNHSSSCSPMGRSSAASSSFNSTNALGLMSAVVGHGERVHDDVAGMVDGSIGGASSVADASMSARLLCVGLDELLLSWTKWVVDNRFYEDRSDLGWLNLPDGSPIQLGGRYFVWSFRHNHQRYFYGVIPKFAKGRLRRQKLMERNRKRKKEAGTPRGATASATTTTRNSAVVSISKDATLKGHRPAKGSTSRSPFTTRQNARPHSTGSSGSHHGGGSGSSSRHDSLSRTGAAAHTDPLQLSTGLSSLQSGGGGAAPMQTPMPPQGSPGGSWSPTVFSTSAVNAAAYASQQQQQQLPQQASYINASSLGQLSDGLDYEEAPSATPSSSGTLRQRGFSHAYGLDSRQQQQQQMPASHSQALYPPCEPSWTAPSPHYTSSPGVAPAPVAASRNSSFPSVRVGTNVAGPPPPPLQMNSASSNSAPGAATAARRAPLLGPPPSQPFGKRHTPRSPSLTSHAQFSSAGATGSGVGGPNYYYQYGGNTFIQDGKRHENEYYPPLPPNTPFHPAPPAANAQLVPLPHPQTERGGIPAIFRYWGPMGHPSSSRSSTQARPAMPPPFAQSQQPLSSRGGRPVFQPGSAPCNSSNFGVSASSPAASAAVVVSVGGNPVTVRVRRRGASTAAAVPSGPSSSSLPVSVPTMELGPAPSSSSVAAAGVMNSSLSNAGAASFPATPLSNEQSPSHFVGGAGPPTAQSATITTTAMAGGGGVMPASAPSVAVPAPTATATAAGAGAVVGGSLTAPPPRRLSPTSMLPANLINEGSKTKGESLLRGEEDTYVQRQAFRWNPYASRKWVAGPHDAEGPGE
ncbi:hypothetical protein ABB37_09016 [Leptomonas pyrrhocoris]|uniref:Uncharacterized protein n=1 Tax=Leptomonas pyrrhocoris TaxID=157538 RepID=A0A0M9FRT4_LEPPY|nr:hypothetical protein ABB37_09016 [Leptomonas pyrrhocoris]KPA74697.1 hypothetical protein ABB37_09016 [Leptomonas pyrrhocoris]|eukprot:XP_015653136.1 hypothetical protein ABB37_09016 [Leptomonas pyrrhocoris]